MLFVFPQTHSFITSFFLVENCDQRSPYTRQTTPYILVQKFYSFVYYLFVYKQFVMDIFSGVVKGNFKVSKWSTYQSPFYLIHFPLREMSTELA